MPDEINLALLILRVAVGLTMFAHGYAHFFMGGRIEGTGRWFDSLGMRPGRVHALMASWTEVGAGLLMAVGLLTTFAAAGFVGLLLVAYITVHRNNGFFILKEGFEYIMIMAVVAVVIAMLGPGEWSLDHAFDIVDDLDGWTGLWISLGVGLGSGAGLMAVFYRPGAVSE